MIPNKFTIGGFEYKVSFLPTTEDDLNGSLGDFSEILHEIRIAETTKVDNKIINISDNDIFLTYLHELGHCFGAYYNGDFSEEFANAFSHFMFDYFRSKK